VPLHNSIISNFRDAGEGGNDGVLPLPLWEGGNRGRRAFHNRLTKNCMVFQDKLETNLLHLFAHSQNSEWFSINFAIIFEEKICCPKTSTMGNDFCFLQVFIAFNSFTSPILAYVPSCLQGMQSLVTTLGNGQIWLGTSPVVVQFILVFFHFVVCNCIFAKNIRSYSDIGKMKDCFWRYVSLKNFNFLRELQ